MLEKHIQLMHGIKDPDVKEMTESTNMEEREVKEDTKVITEKTHSITKNDILYFFGGYILRIFK